MNETQRQALDKPFIAWDGEGENINGHHRLTLLANSTGKYIVDRKRNGSLSYNDWLPFLCNRIGINVWFNFNYDVNMMFKDLDYDTQIDLFQKGLKTPVGDYEIQYIPKKILKIYQGKQHFTHYDVFGFFATSFLKTMKAWKIQTPEIIEKGKDLRGDFASQPLDFIIDYNNAECVKLVEICEKLRQCIATAKITPLRSWHGAGAIASRFLKDWAFIEHMPKFDTKDSYNKPLLEARRYAYTGGRSELFFRGLIDQPVYQYDINSAYPSACRFLPSLKNKTWTHLDKDECKNIKEDDFGLIKVQWNFDYGTRVGAFGFRRNDNTILFPRNGSNWIHNIEVQVAKKKGYKFKILEAWILDRPYHYFLNDQIEKMAETRLKLKQAKDLGNLPIKLGLNSLYGKLAQRPIKKEGGYRHGEFTELFFAGFITAHCRAKILEALDPDNVIMIATDGIFSKVPLPKIHPKEGETPLLGGWEYTKHNNGNFLLGGIYELQDQDNVWHLKTRGYTNMTHEQFIHLHQQQIKMEEVRFAESRFITLKLSLRAPKLKGAEFAKINRIINWNNNKKRIFHEIETDRSDSIAVDRPENQVFSKMYNPKEEIDFSEITQNLYDSIAQEDI